MVTLSVLVPGIRNENWNKLYLSIEKAYSKEFEVIFIGPYDLPKELQVKNNVIYIQSFQSPIACQQHALCRAKGEYITWAADDGVYLSGSLDNAVNLLINEPYTTIVTSKYYEGSNPIGMETDAYYVLYNHDSMKLMGVPKDCYMLNCGVVHRLLLEELGGWDAYAFQVCPLAYSDLAIRAYRHGCKFILQKDIMFSCTHEPGTTGTHAPIHFAQTEHDEIIFRGMYGMPGPITREIIRIDNFKDAEKKWSRRFKGE